MHNRKNILIAPLDWGLGHTSRCMPIIELLLQHNQNVFFAGNEAQIEIIKNKFPSITCLQLNGYNVKYGKSKITFMPKLVMQLPKLHKAIQKENKWINEIQTLYQIDIIISDNRYGLYHKNCTSILLTHQLQIQTGSNLGNYVVQRYLKNYLKQFTKIWIVDTEDNKLAGKLSQCNSMKNTEYIGWLSQFQYSHGKQHPITTNHDFILAILSGPEPARTKFFNLLRTQMKYIDNKNFVIVGGVPNGENIKMPKNIRYIPFADTVTLQQLMNNARLIITRSGYSSIMDMVALEKQAIFIPTPGQTEQSFLADHLRKLKLFNSVSQEKFDLRKILNGTKNYNNNLKFHSDLALKIQQLLS